MNAIYPFLLPFGKFILATGLLIGFYFLLYKRNATYNHSRLYLLVLPLVAALMSWITIEVYTPPPRTIEIEIPSVPPEKETTGENKTTPADPENKKETAFLSHAQPPAAEFDWKKIVLAGYIAVTAVLLLYPLIGTIRILRLKKGGIRETYRGISVIRSDKIQTPFSFFRTIYLSAKLRDAQSQMILAHERWHILHRHYIDVLCIEFITRVLWFNPLLWWVRHELRNIHEYQADRSVLDHGQNIYEYQTTLLEEVMNNSSCLANGFNHSFIKQRFIAMKNKRHIRFSTLRNITIIPFSVLLFVLFTFTEGEAQIIYVHKPSKQVAAVMQEPVQKEIIPLIEEEEKEEPKEKETEEIHLPQAGEEIPEHILSQPEMLPQPEIVPQKPLEKMQEISTTKVESLTREDNKELHEITNRPDYAQISKVALSSIPFTSDIAECPIYIERDEEKTLVTRIFPVLSDWEQMSFPDKNKIMLIDSQTGDRYLLRELRGEYPLGTPFYIRRHRKQMVQFTFLFPPLPSSVKTIDIIDGTNVYGLKIKEHLKKKIKVIR